MRCACPNCGYIGFTKMEKKILKLFHRHPWVKMGWTPSEVSRCVKLSLNAASMYLLRLFQVNVLFRKKSKEKGRGHKQRWLYRLNPSHPSEFFTGKPSL